MENNKIKKAAIITGSLLSGAVLSVTPLHAETGSLTSTDLGTGSEIRATLLGTSVDANTLELTCGEKKEEAKPAEKKADAKAAEHKCGEGKCGEGKCGEKAKTAEHKCGEGKCGEKKEEAKPKSEAKPKAKTEAKPKN